MTRSITAVLMIAASICITTPQTIEAQLGGLIKKKVKEAIKPPEKPAENPPAQSDQSSSGAPALGKQSDDFPRVDGNSIVLSKEILARVMRGMDSELALLADFDKVLAKYPTREAFEECTQKAALSPEGQKIAQQMVSLPANATPEQSRAMIEKMGKEMEALRKKRCPNDPNDWSDYRKEQRLEQIHNKAASMARGKPVSAGPVPHEIGRAALLFEMNPYDTVRDSVVNPAGDTVVVIKGGGLNGHDYEVAIERVVEYCMLKEQGVDVAPKKGGLTAPGAGNGIVWIYNVEELDALQYFDCDAFKKKYKRLFTYWK